MHPYTNHNRKKKKHSHYLGLNYFFIRDEEETLKVLKEKKP